MAVATGLRFLLPWKRTLSLGRTEYVSRCTLAVTICSVPQGSYRVHTSMCVWMSAKHRQASVIDCRKCVCVSAHTVGTHLSLKGVYDEVQCVRLDTFDTLLHHVVTVLVLHTLQHMAIQLPHHLALQRGGGGGGQRWRKRENVKRDM